MNSNVPNSHNEHTPRHRLGAIATALILTVLIGSLVVVTNLAHQSEKATAGTSTVHSQTVQSQLGVYVGSGDGALFKLSAQKGQYLWRYKTQGRTIPAPATVANGIVYVGSLDGSVSALQAVSGNSIWQFKTQSAVLSSPVVANGVVYVGSSDGNLYALRADNGSPLWHFHAGAPTTINNINTVVVINSVVYGSSSDGVANSYLFALNAQSGSQIWQQQIANQSFTDPKVFNDVIYIASWAIGQQGGPDNTASYVYAFNAKDVSQIWRSAKIGNFTLFSPTVVNGVVYIGSQDTYLYAFNATDGSQLWRHNAGGTIDTSPQVANGIVYAGVMGHDAPTTLSKTIDSTQPQGYILALNATTGSFLWQHLLQNYQGTPITVFDNVIYVGSADHIVYALQAANASVIWQYQDANAVAGLSTNAPITVAP
jgi:outer membrane protein assembly factor BamB